MILLVNQMKRCKESNILLIKKKEKFNRYKFKPSSKFINLLREEQEKMILSKRKERRVLIILKFS